MAKEAAAGSRRGRPPGSGLYGEVLRCQISPVMAEQIERWRKARGLPNTSEAVRRLLEKALAAK